MALRQMRRLDRRFQETCEGTTPLLEVPADQTETETGRRLASAEIPVQVQEKGGLTVLIKSALFEKASGSMGGITASRNKGGQYFRGRATPVNPNSPRQQAVRSFMSQLSVLWQDVLTAAQRAGWAAYAENVPVINRIGDQIFLTGLNHYIRSNVPRMQLDPGIRIDDAPIIFNLGDYTQPGFAVDTANDELDVSFQDTDEWANETGSHMLVYAAIPNDPTINFFKGPYQIKGNIPGDDGAAPASPAAIDLGHVIAAGQRQFARIRVSRVDGRLSTSFRGFGDAA